MKKITRYIIPRDDLFPDHYKDIAKKIDIRTWHLDQDDVTYRNEVYYEDGEGVLVLVRGNVKTIMISPPQAGTFYGYHLPMRWKPAGTITWTDTYANLNLLDGLVNADINKLAYDTTNKAWFKLTALYPDVPPGSDNPRRALTWVQELTIHNSPTNQRKRFTFDATTPASSTWVDDPISPFSRTYTWYNKFDPEGSKTWYRMVGPPAGVYSWPRVPPEATTGATHPMSDAWYTLGRGTLDDHFPTEWEISGAGMQDSLRLGAGPTNPSWFWRIVTGPGSNADAFATFNTLEVAWFTINKSPTPITSFAFATSVSIGGHMKQINPLPAAKTEVFRSIHWEGYQGYVALNEQRLDTLIATQTNVQYTYSGTAGFCDGQYLTCVLQAAISHYSQFYITHVPKFNASGDKFCGIFSNYAAIGIGKRDIVTEVDVETSVVTPVSLRRYHVPGMSNGISTGFTSSSSNSTQFLSQGQGDGEILSGWYSYSYNRVNTANSGGSNPGIDMDTVYQTRFVHDVGYSEQNELLILEVITGAQPASSIDSYTYTTSSGASNGLGGYYGCYHRSRAEDISVTSGRSVSTSAYEYARISINGVKIHSIMIPAWTDVMNYSALQNNGNFSGSRTTTITGKETISEVVKLMFSDLRTKTFGFKYTIYRHIGISTHIFAHYIVFHQGVLVWEEEVLLYVRTPTEGADEYGGEEYNGVTYSYSNTEDYPQSSDEPGALGIHGGQAQVEGQSAGFWYPWQYELGETYEYSDSPSSSDYSTNVNANVFVTVPAKDTYAYWDGGTTSTLVYDPVFQGQTAFAVSDGGGRLMFSIFDPLEYQDLQAISNMTAAGQADMVYHNRRFVRTIHVTGEKAVDVSGQTVPANSFVNSITFF